jgi:RimJ/RimL family protein N-acetyltransferase
MGIALYKKFGFEMEGTHRRYAFRDGGSLMLTLWPA